MTSTRAPFRTAACAAQRVGALAIVVTKAASTMHAVVTPPRSPGPGRP